MKIEMLNEVLDKDQITFDDILGTDYFNYNKITNQILGQIAKQNPDGCIITDVQYCSSSSCKSHDFKSRKVTRDNISDIVKDYVIYMDLDDFKDSTNINYDNATVYSKSDPSTKDPVIIVNLSGRKNSKERLNIVLGRKDLRFTGFSENSENYVGSDKYNIECSLSTYHRHRLYLNNIKYDEVEGSGSLLLIIYGESSPSGGHAKYVRLVNSVEEGKKVFDNYVEEFIESNKGNPKVKYWDFHYKMTGEIVSMTDPDFYTRKGLNTYIKRDELLNL